MLLSHFGFTYFLFDFMLMFYLFITLIWSQLLGVCGHINELSDTVKINAAYL